MSKLFIIDSITTSVEIKVKSNHLHRWPCDLCTDDPVTFAQVTLWPLCHWLGLLLLGIEMFLVDLVSDLSSVIIVLAFCLYDPLPSVFPLLYHMFFHLQYARDHGVFSCQLNWCGPLPLLVFSINSHFWVLSMHFISGTIALQHGLTNV